MKLDDPNVALGISIGGIVISLILIGFQYYTDQNIWLGFVMLMSNTTIFLANKSKYKNKRNT